MNDAQRLLCRKSQALEYFNALGEYAEHWGGCPLVPGSDDEDRGHGCTCGLSELEKQARITFATDIDEGE